MDNTQQETTKVTIRNAADFGSHLAADLAETLHQQDIEAFRWPKKFPITIKRILQLPEVNKNNKIAKRASEAARVVWTEIRNEAIQIESFLLANPEFHNHSINHDGQDWSWRELFMEIEQSAGNIFLTDHMNEEIAKKNVYAILRPAKLKNYILEFEDDYLNFINEVRESIRAKKAIAPSIRLELICMLNKNTTAAKRIIAKTR